MAKNGQGEGTIAKRMINGVWDGTWWARISLGYDSNGKRIRKAFYGKTRKEVAEKLTTAKAEMNKGTYVEPSKMTLSQWMDIWLKEYKKHSVKSTNYSNYYSSTKAHIKPILGNYKLKELRNDIIQKFVNTLNEKGLAYETVCAAYKTLNLALKQAAQNELIAKNIAENVSMPLKIRKEIKVLTPDEQERFIIAAQGNQYAGELFILILYTGLRLGEALALEWDDVNFETGMLNVNKSQFNIRDVDDPNSKYHDEVGTPKTKSSVRIIPLLPDILQMLKGVRQKQRMNKLWLGSEYVNSNRVFSNYKGEYLSESIARYHFKRTAQDAGIDGIHIHCLRHTFATRGLERGVEMRVMQEFLGHASISMTADLYTHVLPDKKKDSIMKLADTITI